MVAVGERERRVQYGVHGISQEVDIVGRLVNVLDHVQATRLECNAYCLHRDKPGENIASVAATHLLEFSVRDAACKDAFNDILELRVNLAFPSLLSGA